MKTFDELYAELQEKAAFTDGGGNTRRLLDEGVHAIGKKVVEEAAEAWIDRKSTRLNSSHVK